MKMPSAVALAKIALVILFALPGVASAADIKLLTGSGLRPVA
jgi:hypothetical protein